MYIYTSNRVKSTTPVTIDTMIVLGIESSCDETAVGIVRDGNELLANAVFSSMDLHKIYGGVVPEIAARSHIESIIPVIKEALSIAFPDQSEDEAWEQIDAIAVTYGAGLGGSLLVGVMTARTLAIEKNKPLYAINHVEAHVYANFLTCTGTALITEEQSSPLNKASSGDTTLSAPLLSRSSESTTSSDAHRRLVSPRSPAPVSPKTWKLGDQEYKLPSKQPNFPLVSLIVSGGHSQLVVFRNHFDYTLLGQTRDDAIGEAFDKVAKIIGLPYPGGPSISKAAEQGDPHKYQLPKAKLSPRKPRAINSDEIQGSNEQQASRTNSTMNEERRKMTQNFAEKTNKSLDFVQSNDGLVDRSRYEYSFSGLKTAVLRLAQEEIGEDFTFPSYKIAERLSETQRNDIAASFQRVAVETVVDKTILAYEEFNPKSVVIAGGVAANQELRRQLRSRLEEELKKSDSSNIKYQISNILSFTDIKLCTDNGAMVATLGCFRALNNQPTADPYSLQIEPNLSM